VPDRHRLSEPRGRRRDRVTRGLAGEARRVAAGAATRVALARERAGGVLGAGQDSLVLRRPADWKDYIDLVGVSSSLAMRSGTAGASFPVN